MCSVLIYPFHFNIAWLIRCICICHLFFLLAYLGINLINMKNKVAATSAMSKQSQPVLFLRWFFRMLDKVCEYIFMLKIQCMKYLLHFFLFSIATVLLMKLIENENAPKVLHFSTSMLRAQKENGEILHCRAFMLKRNSHFLFYR